MCVCVLGRNAPGPRSCGDPSGGEREKERDRGKRDGRRRKGGPVCWTGDPISSNRGTETDLVKRGGLNTVD